MSSLAADGHAPRDCLHIQVYLFTSVYATIDLELDYLLLAIFFLNLFDTVSYPDILQALGLAAMYTNSIS